MRVNSARVGQSIHTVGAANGTGNLGVPRLIPTGWRPAATTSGLRQCDVASR